MNESDRRLLGEITTDLMDSMLVFSRRLGKDAPHPGGRHFDPSRFVLKKVHELGPVRMSEIGRNMEISRSYMTALVNKLIREGLVERVLDPHDRRVVMIRITDSGRNALKEFKRIARETVIKRLSSLDSEDIKALHQSMKSIKRILSKLDQEKGVGAQGRL